MKGIMKSKDPLCIDEVIIIGLKIVGGIILLLAWGFFLSELAKSMFTPS